MAGALEGADLDGLAHDGRAFKGSSPCSTPKGREADESADQDAPVTTDPAIARAAEAVVG